MTCHHPEGTPILRATGDILHMWNMPAGEITVHACVTRSPSDPDRLCVEVFYDADLHRVIVAGGEFIERFDLNLNETPDGPEIEVLYLRKQAARFSAGLMILDHTTTNRLRGGPRLDKSTFEQWRHNDLEAREYLDAFPPPGKVSCCHPDAKYMAVGNAIYRLG